MTLGFIPQTITLMFSALLRNMNCAKTPMVASAVAVVTKRQLTIYILYAYSVVFCAKTLNMVLGGIIRSGGKTKYVLITDIIGTWMIGVPLGYITTGN